MSVKQCVFLRLDERAIHCNDCGRSLAWRFSDRFPMRVCRKDIHHPVKPKPPKPEHKPPDPEAAKKRAEKIAKDKADALAGAEAIGDLSLLDKGVHYAAALAKWFRAGCPVRTPAEAARIELICRACVHFDATDESCKICGCKTSSRRWAIASKTKMATEKCPKGFWK